MTKNSTKPKPVLLDFRFLGTALVGTVSVGVVAVFGSLDAQVAILGTWLSILAGLVVAQTQSFEHTKVAFRDLLSVAGLVPSLTDRPDLLEQYLKITKSLAIVSAHTDPVLVQFATQELHVLADQICALAQGEITFASTEAWRMTYEQLLRRKDVQIYRSVAWFKSAEYWQDEPGKKSLQLNLELKAKGLRIERIVIVRDELWPISASAPLPSVMAWLDTQHSQGIKVSLLKESELTSEPELCRDMGIYGHRAVGIQELDERCRTLTFTLYFDKTAIQRALSYWRSLSLYARPYEKLLAK